jgi:deazaflavin-dependent oxidoreductase (nitroreductase family)
VHVSRGKGGRIPFFYSDDELRAMYRDNHGNRTARRYARFWASIFGLGLAPRRWVTLEVVGRRSGKITRFPLGMATCDGQSYVVSMLGNDCNWVENVRAADGEVVLRRRRAEAARLVEVPPGERARIIKRYLEQVPGARPHIAVDRRADLRAFEGVANDHPVFLVSRGASGRDRARPHQ